MQNAPNIKLRSLNRMPETEAQEFGGKAHGLARLKLAGVEIPETYLISPTATLPDCWSEAFKKQIVLCCKSMLEAGPMVVRSSALVEDGQIHSYAGLFESVTGIVAFDQLFHAMTRVIASGDSERISAYNFIKRPIPVGLVLQPQIAAVDSGVCFTRNPANSDSAAIVEIVSGMGEALVSGHSAGTRWRIYRSYNGTLEFRCDSMDAALKPDYLAILVETAWRLESKFGYPLDLEWAIDPAGKLWWLQARPITATLRIPVRDIDAVSSESADLKIWSNFNFRETMADPLTPLTWSLWRDGFSKPIVASNFQGADADRIYKSLRLVDRIDGRIYFNLSACLSIPMLHRIMPVIASYVDISAGTTIRELLDQKLLLPQTLPLTRLELWLLFLTAKARDFKNTLPALNPNYLRIYFQKHAQAILHLERRVPQTMTTEDLLSELDFLRSQDAMQIDLLLRSIIVAATLLKISQYYLKAHPRAQSLLGAANLDNATVALQYRLADLTRKAAAFKSVFLDTTDFEALKCIMKESPDGRNWLNAFNEFLLWNGQRCPGEFEVRTPRWSDCPQMLLDLIRDLLRNPQAEDAIRRHERLKRERALALETALQAQPFWFRPLLKRLFSLTALHLPLRESGKHVLLLVFRRIRTLALELGSRLCRLGRLAEPEDIFFIELPEFRDFVHARHSEDWLRQIAVRKSEHARWSEFTTASFVRSDFIPVHERKRQAVTDADLIAGSGVSHGKASGKVRILHRPDPALIEDGDILVMRYADPGWTPLFNRAGAVVMEIGGLLCHAAVVARELGLPAIMGAHEATIRLQDRDIVHVDADLGLVRILEKAKR